MKKSLLLYLLLVFSVALQGNVYFKHLDKTDGLPQISVISICQDELGRMWFGTLEGLGCYDGNSMTVYKPSSMGARDFLGNGIHNLVGDKQGNIFFTSDNALIRYDLHKEQFFLLQQKATCLHVQEHEVWMATRDSVFKWDRAKEQFSLVCHLESGKRITCLYADPDGCLWIGGSDGLYRIDHPERPKPVCVVPDVNVRSIYKDRKGSIWVAAYHRGIYKIVQGTTPHPVIESGFAISNSDVRCFVEDDEGAMWVGTFNGLSKIDSLGNISCYRKDTQPGSLKHSSVFSLYKDLQGTIWVGTFYGGVHYFNTRADQFRHYSENADRADCLSFFFVGNMVEDKQGDIWICTEGGGLNHLNRKTRLFAHYLTDDGDTDTSFSNLKCIAYDSIRNCLYIGTHKQGLLTFDLSSKSIRNHTYEAGTSLAKMTLRGDSLYILSNRGMFVSNLQTGATNQLYPSIPETHMPGLSFLIDSKGYLWIAQYRQVLRVNMNNPREGQVYKYGERGLTRFQVLKMVEHPNGSVYLGTSGGGLYEFLPQEAGFRQCSAFNITHCYDLSVTSGGYLVVSNEKGLLFYHPQTKETKLFDVESQLHLSAINDGCGLLVCRDGEIFVGGIAGMTSFMDTALSVPPLPYNLYFSSLAVNDKPVSCEVPNHILGTALPFAGQVELEHDENNIAITVASNSYIDNADRKVYEYRLEGFSKEWSTTHNSTVVYTNLDPGKYKLVVREKRQASSGGNHSISLSIVVHSPWWATWLAYLIYIGIGAAIVGVLLNNWRTKMRLRASLAQEKLEKEKNEELIQAKLQFFANISHEFRTPLTLIISQLEALLQQDSLSPFLRARLQKIYKNTFQFRELISELLDFRKMERGKLHLHVCQADIVSVLKPICRDFAEQAQLQNIHFEFHPEAERVLCWCDERQLRKVFSNLLSNAFKHTPEKGRIELQVHENETDIEIRVMDTGEGIPQEALPYIFDRFYQVDTTATSPGSGIGLALSKGLVELHHGKIGVQSALHYGSIFTVTLPKENLFGDDACVTFVAPQTTADDLMPLSEEQAEESPQSVETNDEHDVQESLTDKDCVLVVEDNEELLQILTSLLSPLYRVVIAMNGKEGLQKAVEEHPDLILSDVMMPEMSGTEMCLKIKNNFDLCHIPVILLTALTSDNNKMEGLHCGADEYIEKPFNSRMLLGRIANVIRNRKLLKQKFGKEITATPPAQAGLQALAFNQIDAQFLTRLERVVTEHLSDPDFDVNVLARELAVSRSSLYNKLKALSCMTPNEFILNIRLKHAAKLLKDSPELQITEIAYQTGFSSLRYFRHCFKAHFNQAPQEYRCG